MLPSDKFGPRGGKNKASSTHAPLRSRDAKQALIILAKAPIPGQVKTRLCPPLSDDEAASLYGSMVMDVLERCKPLREFDRYLSCAPTTDHPFFKTMEARFGVQLWEQIGSDLGERMNHAVATAFGKGYQKVLVIGTDIPTLSGQTCLTTSNLLKNHDVVFGPTPDGGYYLLGMNRPAPELFHDIPWSTPSVLSISLEKARRLGLSVGQLHPLQDIDTLEDLKSMVSDLLGPGKKHYSNRTANVLLALAQRHLPKK